VEPSVTILTPAGNEVGALWWPPHALKHLWRLRDTIARFYRRELERLYAGTVFGLFLAVLQSLVLLGVYTVVFGHVFEARLGGPERGGIGFGISLFAALLTFNLFADSLAGASGLIAANGRLVTKVVFPVEVLPVCLVLRVATVSAISLGLLAGAVLLERGSLPATAPLGLVLLGSFALFSLGGAYAVAALGAYARDVGHLVAIATRVLLFATPIFYTLDQVGPTARALLLANPVSWAVEASRLLLVEGALPPAGPALALLAAGPLCAWLGLVFFMKLRGGFSDVV
jgi:lipopolysaccharide transport system permease protein